VPRRCARAPCPLTDAGRSGRASAAGPSPSLRRGTPAPEPASPAGFAGQERRRSVATRS
jgi:hypothetical protein